MVKDDEEEKETKMHEHGFGNLFARYNDDDDDGNGFASTMENDDNDTLLEFNPCKPVTNGYMSIQPIVKEFS